MKYLPTPPPRSQHDSRIAFAARTLIACMLIAFPAAAVGLSGAGDAAKPPKLIALQYYEDLEDGKRHNVVADLKGKPNRVRAKAGGVKAEGRLSKNIGPGEGNAKSWFFRKKAFVKQVLAEFAADGTARVKVKAGAGAVREICLLELEPDPDFGDFAEGDCEAA